MKTLGVYIHIPFCVQKCRYCDFLSAPATRDYMTKYVSTLKREIENEAAAYKEYLVESVFFGGGTPSILEAEEIAELIRTIKKQFHLSETAEISLEMNPGTVDEKKLDKLQKAGVNRLSIGLQSAQNTELRMLGRIHTFEDFQQTYEMARKSGFRNINIDLMSALPGQSRKTWMDTMEQVLALKPEHISAYSLIVEEGTYLHDHLSEFPPLPSEEEDRRMYQDTKRILAQYGYERYEISNYAQKGYVCRHNITYWTRGNYVGFGLGAASMVENVRWKNTDDREKYGKAFSGEIADGIKEEMEYLTTQECMEEFMFLGLRMMQGVSEKEFFSQFFKSLDEVYGEVIEKWEKRGYLVHENGYVRLTEDGIDISNQIFADFFME